MTTSKAASITILEELHNETVKALLERVKSGTATAADLNVARAMLKDNNIDAIPKDASPLNDLAKSLPFPDADGVAGEEGSFH
jgi:hypothetical protein